MMTHVDLFSGIGGFALAAKWAGFETVAFCEIDGFCQKVLRKHWPDVPIHDDVKTFPTDAYRGCTLLTGGFPCQDISDLGNRAGIEGERSGLWTYLADTIRAIRPDYAVIENVPALLRRGFSRVLSDLAALRYDAEWCVLRANALGLPHTRERIFVVAYPNESNGQARMGVVSYRAAQIFAADLGDGHELRLQAAYRPSGVDDGLSGRVYFDRGGALGNAIVPQVVYPILKAIFIRAALDYLEG